MQDMIVRYTGLLAYTAVVAVLLLVVVPQTMVAVTLLTLLPMIYFWRRLHLHTRVVFYLALWTVAATAWYEVFADTYGVWYSMGIVPIISTYVAIEPFIVGFLQVLYMVILYEFFCDDRKSAGREPRRGVWLFWSVLMVALVVAFLYVFPIVFVSYAFLTLVLTVTAVIAITIGYSGKRAAIARIATRIGVFLCLWLPLAAVYEIVAVTNGARIYANMTEYVYTFSVLGNFIPIEALLFAVLSPVWVISLYELHVDDTL
jgi:hypothetical protein